MSKWEYWQQKQGKKEKPCRYTQQLIVYEL